MIRSLCASVAVFCTLSLAAVLPAGASASANIQVRLEDPTSGLGATAMRIVLTPSTAPAGRMTFDITNTSRTQEHEMLLIRLPDNSDDPLPYDQGRQKVIENEVDKLGDSGDLRPGMSRAVTVTLAAGRYLVMCNEPGHYEGGMWAWLTVKPK